MIKMKKTKNGLLEHFMKPRNVGLIEKYDGYSSVENPVNGFRTDIYIKIKKDRIEDIKFKSIGCTATIASASAITELVKGKGLNEIIVGVNTFDNLLTLLYDELGKIPDKNWHCPPTAILSLITAIKNYYSKINNKEKIHEINIIIDSIKKYFDETLRKL
jgi:nitrogen fixation NifU-like protein